MNKALKIGKYYLISGVTENPEALLVGKVLAISPEIVVKLVESGTTTTVTQKNIIRRVWKLKEGIKYVLRDGRQVTVTRDSNFPQESDYAFYLTYEGLTRTEYGSCWLDNTESPGDIVGKVKGAK